MSGQRVIQNFRNSRALLWCAPGHAADALLASLDGPLRKLGVSLARVEALDAASLEAGRDIVLFDADSDLDAARLLGPGATVAPVPVVGLVGVEAPSRLKALVALGATSFLRKPVHEAAVYSSLFLAVNGHRRLHALERRIAEQDRRRRGRRFVVKAIVHLMKTQDMSDDEAFEALRRDSMQARQAVEDYCEAFLASVPAAPASPSPYPFQENTHAKRVAENSGGIGADGAVHGDANLGGRPDQARRA